MGLFNKFFGGKIRKEAGHISAAQIDKIKRKCGYNYSGSFTDTSRAGGAKWRGGLSQSGVGNMLNHYTLRLNARRAYHDSLQARAIIQRKADTVADVGLKLECTPKGRILNVSDAEIEAWASEVEERFDAWAQSKRQHRAEEYNWYQSHRMNSIFQERDGEVFQRLFYADDAGLQNPLQFDFIDPNQIYGDAITTTHGLNQLQGFAGFNAVPSYAGDGIKRDSRGRPVSYKIWVVDPANKTSPLSAKDIPVRDESGQRIFLLHAFAPEYAGQGRGYSRLAHALQEFENITDFSAAHVKKAINQSNLVMYVKPSADAPSSQPFEQVMSSLGAGPASEQFGGTPSPPAGALNVTSESVQPVTCYRLPEATFEVPGSTVVANLEAGEEIKPGPNNSPVDSYDRFVDTFTAYLSASLSVPIELVLMRFAQNYSASRATLILFWRIAQIWQEEMAADILNPTYEMWLSGEVAAGRVSAPGWLDPRRKAAWLACKWIGVPLPNIDPKRTADADKTYIEIGAQTLDMAARKFNGSDGRTNRAKLKTQYSELPPAPWAPKKPAESEKKEEEED